jgi:hypothetical protein
MTIYQEVIVEATGVGEKDAGFIEDIMRNDIFHSNLDWQTKAQLVRAAKQAVKLLKAYREEPSLAEQFPV